MLLLYRVLSHKTFRYLDELVFPRLDERGAHCGRLRQLMRTATMRALIAATACDGRTER